MVRVRWWGTGVVALVLLVFGAGLPLLDRALGTRGQPLAPAAAAQGSVAETRNPPPGRGPASAVPPQAAARS
ncbi:hypothetical protein, partial [Actinomadura sp. NPDC049753]|uniref:hypothetical protein n=1 Tax=Actinomadura sp. NPDC049753 TaxID=3154739 RepID=UPI00344474DC